MPTRGGAPWPVWPTRPGGCTTVPSGPTVCDESRGAIAGEIAALGARLHADQGRRHPMRPDGSRGPAVGPRGRVVRVRALRLVSIADRALGMPVVEVTVDGPPAEVAAEAPLEPADAGLEHVLGAANPGDERVSIGGRQGRGDGLARHAPPPGRRPTPGRR